MSNTTADISSLIAANITTNGRLTSASKLRNVLGIINSSFANFKDGGNSFESAVGYDPTKTITFTSTSFVTKKYVDDSLANFSTPSGSFLPLSFTANQIVSGSSGKSLSFSVDTLSLGKSGSGTNNISIISDNLTNTVPVWDNTGQNLSWNFDTRNFAINRARNISLQGYGVSKIDGDSLVFSGTRNFVPSGTVLAAATSTDLLFNLKSDSNGNVINANWGGKIGYNTTLTELNSGDSSFIYKALNASDYTATYTGGKGVKITNIPQDAQPFWIDSKYGAFSSSEGVVTIVNEQGALSGATGDVTFFQLKTGATNPAIGDGITTTYSIRGLDGTNNMWQSGRHVVQTTNSVAGDIFKHCAVQRFYITHNLTERLGLEIFGETTNGVAKLKTHGVRHFNYAAGTATDGFWKTDGTIASANSLTGDYLPLTFTADQAIALQSNSFKIKGASASLNYLKIHNELDSGVEKRTNIKHDFTYQTAGGIIPTTEVATGFQLESIVTDNVNKKNEVELSLRNGSDLNRVVSVNEIGGIACINPTLSQVKDYLDVLTTKHSNLSTGNYSEAREYITIDNGAFKLMAVFIKVPNSAASKRIELITRPRGSASELNSLKDNLVSWNLYTENSEFQCTSTGTVTTSGGGSQTLDAGNAYTWDNIANLWEVVV